MLYFDVSLYAGLTNIHLSNLKFNLTSNDDLSDRTSLSYLEISLNIGNYVSTI